MSMRMGKDFDDFVRKDSAGLLRTAYALVGDYGHAEDLLQTALLRTARRWTAARDAPEAYARRVLVNLCRDRARGLRRRPRESALADQTEPPGPIDELAERVGQRHRVVQALMGLPAPQRHVAIDRIVDGQFYLHTNGPDGRVRWYRDTNPTNHPSVKIPDPRTLFGLLDPSARFKIIGHEVVDGVRLTELRATKAPALHALGWLPGVAPGARVELLTVWVDRHNIVHRMSMRVRQVTTTDPIYLRKHADGTLEFVVPSKAYLKAAQAMARKLRPPATAGIDPKLSAKVRHDIQVAAVSVTFSGFGHQPVITAPKNAIPQYTRS